MRIERISIKNFGSYFEGPHEISMKDTSGIDGYAIFGQIGRGKTTIIKAVHWGLYGEVIASSIIGGKLHEKPRPYIDYNKQKEGLEAEGGWCLPLVNNNAFRQGFDEMVIEVDFEHEGSNYSLIRIAKPKVKNPKNDKNMGMEISLTMDKRSIEKHRIENTIEKIMPEAISQFFFVEVDNIGAFSELLFSSQNPSIVEQVELILGIPAIDKSEEDFQKKKNKHSRKRKKLMRDANKGKDVATEHATCEAKIEQAKKDIANYREQIDSLNHEIDEIDEKLEDEPTATDLMARKKDCMKNIQDAGIKLKEHFEDRRMLIKNGFWKVLVKKGITNAIERLTVAENRKEDLQKQINLEGIQRTHHNELAVDKGVDCKVCGNKTEGSSPDEMTKAAKKVIELDESIKSKQEEIDSIGRPGKEISGLAKIKTNVSLMAMDEIEFAIGRLETTIFNEITKKKAVEDELRNHDELSIQKMKNDRDTTMKNVGDLEGEEKAAIKILKIEEEKEDKLSTQLENAGTQSLQIKQLKAKIDIYNWLSDCFKKAMNEFKQEARESVQKIATDAFMEMETEPEKYDRIEVGDDWSVKLIEADGNVAPAGNPGTRQTLAVCVFDGLRRTSNLQFPTFFDNPGSNISDEVIQNMAEYFWRDNSSQMVMLSHSGGLKEEETIEKYGEKLSGAWRVVYDSESSSSIIEELLMK